MSGLSMWLGKGAVTDNMFPLDLARAVNKRYIIYIILLSGILKGNGNNFQCCFQCWQLIHLRIRYWKRFQWKHKVDWFVAVSSVRKRQKARVLLWVQSRRLSGVNGKWSYTSTVVWRVRWFQRFKYRCKEMSECSINYTGISILTWQYTDVCFSA